jgi:GntR family transcriptional regulator
MPDSMYRQIADDLRQKIESGELGPGALLPAELQLRGQYDASGTTVRDAVKWLIGMGLVETRPGQGTFVVEKIDPFVTTLTQVATAVVASELQLAQGGAVVSRHPKRYIDDILWSLQTSFYPMALVERGATGLAFIRLPDDGSVAVFEALRTSFGESGTPLRLTITAYPVDRNQFVMNVGTVPTEVMYFPE